MGEIQFPDFSGLGSLMALDRQSERDKLDRARLERHDQWMQQDRTEARDLQKLQFQQALSDKQRAQMKDAADATSQAALGVLGAPEAERPAAYQSALGFLKARGLPTDNLPPEYTKGMDGMLRFYVQRAESAHEYLKREGDRPQALPPVGGGAPGGALGGPAPNRDQFVSMMMPHALEVSRQTGLDPRLVLAQSALETGFGTAAPGNNYFGIKSHGQPGGQTLATTEAGPGGLVPTQDSFRTYGDVGGSAKDYTDFIKTNGRYGPVMAAQGLDAQIDAMGKAGYATDPNYAAKLRQIAQTIGGPQPTMDAQPGPQLAQAGGTPVIPQGGGEQAAPPRAAPAKEPHFDARMWLHEQIPGAAPYAKKDGELLTDGRGLTKVKLPDGNIAYIAIPVPKPEQPPAGYRQAAGGLEYIPGGPADPVRAQAEKVPSGYRVKPDGSGSFEFIPGGPADPAIVKRASPMNNEQARDAGFADRMMQAEDVLRSVEGEGSSTFGRLSEKTGLASGYLQSKEYQSFKQARDNFINAQLRRESGAAINADEYVKADKQYFPQPGDDPDTVKQKALNRKLAVEGMVRGAGPTYQPSPSVPKGPKPLEGAERESLLFDARKAIEQGAPRDAVLKRLKEKGVEGGL